MVMYNLKKLWKKNCKQWKRL